MSVYERLNPGSSPLTLFFMANVPKIVLAGGVSGGHTFPLIAVARALRREFPTGIGFLFLGARGAFNDSALSAEGIPAKYVLAGKVRRYFSLANFIDPFKIPLGMAQSLWHLWRFLPDAVFAKGGSASVPVVLAAWLYRIPVVLHDCDAVAGRANRFLARFAARIAIAYPSAHAFFPAEKTALLGNPIREELFAGDAARGAASLSLDPAKTTIFFVGGSLGAQALNKALLHILPELLKAGYQVVHQTGETDFEAVKKAAEERGVKSGYSARAFFSATELADIFALSHLVVSRAGANAISELAALGKACILVPLPSAANDEQRMNAYEVAKIGGAVVMEEANLGENMLFHKITELLGNTELRKTMGENLGQFYHPEAAQHIARGIKELISK